MTKKLAFSAAVVVLCMRFPAMAQDAQAGKDYEITIASEENNQYTGPYGQAKVGKVVIQVPNAKKGQKYKVKITDIKENQYTKDTQASCDFEQVGGDRKGNCLGAP